MSNVLPYNAIPFVEWPPDYQHHLAPLLAQAYQQHGPIFRAFILRHYTLELIPDQQIYQFYRALGWPVEGIRMRVAERK